MRILQHLFRIGLAVIGGSLASNGQEPGTKLWEFTTLEGSPDTVSSAAIGPDGTIYFTGRSGVQEWSLFAVNPDGSKKWNRPESCYGTPAVGADGTIYVSAGTFLNGRLLAVSAEGTREWSFETQSGIPSELAIDELETMYFGATLSFLAVSSSGVFKWGLGNDAKSPTISRDGTIYYLGARSVHSVRPDGRPNNSYFQVGNDAMTPLTIGADGTIYTGYTGGSFYALNSNLTHKWSFDPSPAHVTFSEPAIANDGTLYVVGDGSLYALTPGGSNKWIFHSGSGNTAGPAVADDGTIYFGGGTTFFAVNPDGSEKWKFPSLAKIRSSPAIGADGTVYFGADDGRLYALKGTARLARSAWPMAGHDLRRSRKSSCFAGEPCFDAIQSLKTGESEMTLIGDESREYFAETSEDLREWAPLTNGISANGTLFFRDSTTNVPYRFYRAFSR